MIATAAAAVIAGIGVTNGAVSPRTVTGTGDTAAAAGRAALDSAGARVADLLILAASAPDPHCPATAPQVACRMGLAEIGAYDVTAGCPGFIHALVAATEAIAAGGVRSVLVIGADTHRTVADGAGAVLLRRGRSDEPGAVLVSGTSGVGVRADQIVIAASGTAAASVPLALADAVGRGVVPVGGRVLLTAFGVGPAWGSVAIRWPDARPVYAEADRSPAHTDIVYVSAASAEPAPKAAAYVHADYFCAEWGAL
jgi:3-oxoacyl-[acyl-carrier-protein] synthase III